MEYHSFLSEKEINNLKEMIEFGFRLLMEYHSFLLIRITYYCIHMYVRFPSPYGVIFILTKLISLFSNEDENDFRLLMEYHSFLFDESQKLFELWTLKVSVSLRSYIHSYSNNTATTETVAQPSFPSPYGVSFILMKTTKLWYKINCTVSVSLWSIIHSYWLVVVLNKKIKSIQVSVSLWSIIHSYLIMKILISTNFKFFCFRLLMEYHSFLFLSSLHHH